MELEFKEYMKAILEYNVEPEFKISENAFVVVLPNVNYKIDVEDNDFKVLKIIKNKENISRKDIEIELDLSKSTINLLLNKLLKDGKIQQKGKGRNITYSIKK